MCHLRSALAGAGPAQVLSLARKSRKVRAGKRVFGGGHIIMAQDRTTERTDIGADISGALVGWARQSSRHGIVMTLQVVHSAADYRDHRYHKVSVALNDRQLRSLARDLARAARARGLSLRSKPPWRTRVWLFLRGLVSD